MVGGADALNLKSPALYMQAAFRARTPAFSTKRHLPPTKGTPMCSIFDPARTLLIYEAVRQTFHRTPPAKDDTEGAGASRICSTSFRSFGDGRGREVPLDARKKSSSIPGKSSQRELMRMGFRATSCSRTFPTCSVRRGGAGHSAKTSSPSSGAKAKPVRSRRDRRRPLPERQRARWIWTRG